MIGFVFTSLSLPLFKFILCCWIFFSLPKWLPLVLCFFAQIAVISCESLLVMRMRSYTALFAALRTRVSRYYIRSILFVKVCLVSNFNIEDTVPGTRISTSKPSTFPSSLRDTRSLLQTVTLADRSAEVRIEKTCPKCARTEMFWTAVQLRSADEGSTVFYRCLCGYMYAILPRKRFVCCEHMLISLTGKLKTINGKMECTKMWKTVYFWTRAV